jgi:hypothetical protein
VLRLSRSARGPTFLLRDDQGRIFGARPGANSMFKAQLLEPVASSFNPLRFRLQRCRRRAVDTARSQRPEFSSVPATLMAVALGRMEPGDQIDDRFRCLVE